MCMFHNGKKILSKVLEGSGNLSEQSGILIKLGMLGWMKEQLT
jgi:hypothetical protein